MWKISPTSFPQNDQSKIETNWKISFRNKKKDKSIDSFSRIFVPNKFDATLQVINKIGHINSETKTYKAPSSATEIGSSLKKCCKLFISVCIKERNQQKKKDAEEFLILLEEDLPTFVNRPAMETRLEQIRRKKIALPTLQDVSKFNEFIEMSVNI